jgi:hypothetical protein
LEQQLHDLRQQLKTAEDELQERRGQAEQHRADLARVTAERDQFAAGVPLVCSDDRHAAKARGLEQLLTAGQKATEYWEGAYTREVAAHGQTGAKLAAVTVPCLVPPPVLAGLGTGPSPCIVTGPHVRHSDGAGRTWWEVQEEPEHVCKPGASTYFCPASGKAESDCHGGFDRCCDAPELHRPVCSHPPKMLGMDPVTTATVCQCGHQVAPPVFPKQARP